MLPSALQADFEQHLRDEFGWNDQQIAAGLVGAGLVRNPQVDEHLSPEDQLHKGAELRYAKSQILKPFKVSLIQRSILLQQAHDRRTSTTEDQRSVIEMFTGLPTKASECHLQDLRPIGIKDLLANKRHSEYYLLARTIALPEKGAGICLLIEDENGDATLLDIRNSEERTITTQTDLDALYPLGTILVIKEPFFGESLEVEDSYRIHVDSPTDIVYLETHCSLRTSAKWTSDDPNPARHCSAPINYRQLGNDLFKQKKFLLAKKMYSEGIQSLSGKEERVELALLHLNRSRTNLNLELYSAAFDDSKVALRLLADDDDHELQKKKAQLCAAQALERMRLLRQSIQAFQDFAALYPESEEAVNGVQRLERKIRESQTGDYNWDQILSTSSDALDIGDFIGPIKVQSMLDRGGGRGVVATRHIKAGELLVCERAFTFGESSDTSETPVYSFDLESKRMEVSSGLKAISNLISTLTDDSSLLEIVFSLYGGDQYLSDNDDEHDLGKKQSEHKVIYNSTPDVVNFSERDWPVENSLVSVDAGRVAAIVAHNKFGTLAEDASRKSSRLPSSLGTTAVFLQTSFFNQSCEPNACWIMSKETMIVRAQAEISANAEIFIYYSHPSSKGRSKDPHFPDGCPCHQCQEDKKGNLEHRIFLIDTQFPCLKNKVLDSGLDRVDSATLKEVEEYIAALDGTYPKNHSLYRPHLEYSYHIMAKTYHGAGLYHKAITYHIRSLATLGVTVIATRRDKSEFVLDEYSKFTPARVHSSSTDSTTSAGDYFIHICALFRFEGRKELATAWMQMALQHEQLRTGGGKEFFKQKHKELLSKDFIKKWGVPKLLD